MVENGEQPKAPTPDRPKKGVSIQIAFPCESDDEAMAIKRQIDNALAKIDDKRYTFSIAELPTR